MDLVLFTVGGVAVTPLIAAAACAGVLVLAIAAFAVIFARSGRVHGEALVAANTRNVELQEKLAGLLQSSYEMNGRMQTMAEIFGSRTSDLARLVNERMDAQGQRVGQAIEQTNTKTNETLGKLQERLAVIDRAQTNITQLSQDVVGLQQILANKQTRGAFGQGRMEAIITDGFAPGSFAFQYTLSSGKRPDCVIFMPNGGPKLVVDAKFPLEAWQRLGEAKTDVETKQAEAGFRRDVLYHVRSISESYIVADETQDTALMFVPSESIFADIHERFEDVVQKAMRSRVLIVSPSMLLLAVQVIQGLLRDVRMKEEAHKIQKEVRELIDDIGRLKDRVLKLQTHFTQANEDISNILTSTHKVVRRGERITSMELDDPVAIEAPIAAVVADKKVSGGLF